jgi:leucyl-tRNA synthetase
MFMGPFEHGAPWDTHGILGVERFLKRVWNYYVEPPTIPAPPAARVVLHKTIKKVGEDIGNFKFNTAISALMILLNEIEKVALEKGDRETFIKLLHPFAPHMAQELWASMGHATYLDFESWPDYDKALIVDQKINLVFQVNGKTRDAVVVDANITEDDAKLLAMANAKIKVLVGSTQPKKVIYVEKRLVNIVI